MMVSKRDNLKHLNSFKESALYFINQFPKESRSLIRAIDKKIIEIYQSEDFDIDDIKQFSPGQVIPTDTHFIPLTPMNNDRPGIRPHKKSIIEREDIIKCIHLELDLDGNTNPELELGKEYRVIDIHKDNGILTYYEIFDDAANTGIRIPVLPKEIELVRKFIRGPAREVKFDITKVCECGEIVALILNNEGTEYVGTCEDCGKIYNHTRIASNAKSAN